MIPAEARDFIFLITSELVLKLTQLPIQWVAEGLSSGVKQLGHEADHSPQSSSQVKNEWGNITTPPLGLHAAYRGSLAFTFYET
jgi:hypothetical protein